MISLPVYQEVKEPFVPDEIKPLLESDDCKILVAFSGGKDSVAMVKPEQGAKLLAEVKGLIGVSEKKKKTNLTGAILGKMKKVEKEKPKQGGEKKPRWKMW